MNISSPQPNMVAEENTDRLPAVSWALLVLTGIGTGLGTAELMWILRTVQHSFWTLKTGISSAPYAAENYSAVLKALLSSHSPFVYVVDDEGRYGGVMSANRAIDPEISGPLDTTTASDLADHITPLATIRDPTEAQSILHASPHRELPVIDEKTRRIVGILQRQSR
jgi:hypothetical protein